MPLDSVTNHRKAVGKYNAIEKKPIEKAITKAFRKAHNSCQGRSQRVHSKPSKSVNSTLMTIVKVALVASVVAATIPSANAITNGISRQSNANAIATFPKIHNYAQKGHAFCGSIRIAPNQVLTAKHCIRAGTNTTQARNTAFDWAIANNTIKSNDTDLAILTFSENLLGNTHCVPVMSTTTYQMLKDSPSDICGLKGRFIMLGYSSHSEAPGTARAAVFDPMPARTKNRKETPKSTDMKGVPVNNKPVYPNPGDSGAGIVGCNPVTGKYELVGIHSQSPRVKSSRSDLIYSVFVNLIEHPELGDWVTSNRGSCTEENIDPNDIYDTSVRNTGERHYVDKCKLPPKYYSQANMSNEEICDCYAQKDTQAPSELNCYQNDFTFPACMSDHPLPLSSEVSYHHISSRCTQETKFQIKRYCKTSPSAPSEITIPALGYDDFPIPVFTKSAEFRADCANPFTDGTFKQTTQIATAKLETTATKKPFTNDDAACLKAKVTEVEGNTTLNLHNLCDDDVVINFGFENDSTRNIVTLLKGHEYTETVHMTLSKTSVLFSKGEDKNKPIPNFFD